MFSLLIRIIAGWLSISNLVAATLNVLVVPSPTQAVLSYLAPNSSPCTVEVSTSNTYSPLVHDVDSTLFSGANLDSRTGALSSSGNNRIFVAGTRAIQIGLNSNSYSRALQTGTLYYYRITCGASVGTGSFTTKTLPFGATYQDLPPINSNGTYNFPSYSTSNRAETIVDSQTGVLMRHVNIASDQCSGCSPVSNPFPSPAGFAHLCNDHLTAYGNYLCIFPDAGGGVFPDVYAINPATGAVLFLGAANISGQQIDPNAYSSLGVVTDFSANVAWDQTDPDTAYLGYGVGGLASNTSNTIPSSFPAALTFSNILADGNPLGTTLTYMTTGRAITIQDNNTAANTISGTVTSYSGSTLVISATSATGSGTSTNWGIPGRNTIVKWTYTGADNPANNIPAVPGSSPAISPAAVTDMLGGGDLNNLGYAYNSALDLSKFGFSFNGIQGNYVVMTTPRGSQGTQSWFAAYSLGNGLPLGSGGTGAMAAMAQMWFLPATRWCTEHSYEVLPSNAPIMSEALDSMDLGVVGGGPYTVVLGTNMSTVTTSISVSSSSLVGGHVGTCQDTWTTPGSPYANGDPLSPCLDHYLQHVAVGDVIQDVTAGSSELMQVASVISPTSWTVTRAIGGSTAANHSSGDQFVVMCQVFTTLDEPQSNDYVFWNFVASPDGTNPTYYATNIGSHPVTRMNHRVDSQGYLFNPNAAPGNQAAWGTASPYLVQTNPVFGGAYAVSSGNSFQKHLCAATWIDTWFCDGTYMVGANAFSGTSSAITAVVGTTHVWEYNPFGAGSVAAPFSPKALPILGKTFSQALTEKSGPGVILSDSDDYVYCYAYAAGECAAGSSATNVYFSLSTLDTTNGPYCTGGENGTTIQDICIGPFSSMGAAAMQYRYPQISDLTGASSYRALSRTFISFTNQVCCLNPTAGGEWMIYFTPTTPTGTTFEVWLLQVPPDPGNDGINRGDFVPATLNLTAPTGLGVATARVRFGYAEHGAPSSYYCTARTEACIATASTVSDMNPYSFATTDTYSPANCATNCTIAIPVFPLHTAYYTVEFLNSGGSVVAMSQGVAVENTVVPLIPASATAVRNGGLIF